MDAGLFNSVRELKFTSRKHRVSDDDAVDRVNSFYTPVIIVLLSTIVMTKMYLVGKPIQCWIPIEFRGAWEEYAESYCWVKNTYFLPDNASIYKAHETGKKAELKYYQWVPFLLALQAMMFYLPSFLWKLLNWQSGIQLKSLVELAVNCPAENPDEREARVALAASHVQHSIVNKRLPKPGESPLSKAMHYGQKALFCSLSSSGSYLIVVYLLIKLLYLANCIGQFFLMNAYLNPNYDFYGVQVLLDLWRNHDWRHSGHFPRITMCDFDIRAHANIRPYTLTCVLVVNLFNEKIFIFLWFLLLAVSVATLVSTVDWVLWAVIPSRRSDSMRRLLQPQSEELFSRFSRRHIKPDGALVMRIMTKNAGVPVAHDILQVLWRDFCNNQPRAKYNGDELNFDDEVDASPRAPIADGDSADYADEKTGLV